jgi:DNA polymerase-1
MEQLHIIRTKEGLEELARYISDKDFVAFDTETDGVDKESRIIGFSVCADVEVGYYVILSYWDVDSQKLLDLETKAGAKAFLEALCGKQLIMQNAGFDCSMVQNNFGVDLMPSLHTDTMILAHLLDENRPCGLKELGVVLFGEDARKEQVEMKESVHKNGGQLTKASYELYKADADLIARYGAKDAILTLKIFYAMVPDLFEQKLDAFFYDDESMPLLRGPTYELNTTGLRVDPEKLQTLKSTLEAEILEAKAFVYKEITPHVRDKYPGTGKTNQFNINSGQQLAWLLFHRLDNEFNLLSEQGRELCKAMELRLPYAAGAKRDFVRVVTENKGRIWKEASFNPATKKMGRPKVVADPWTYMATGKATLQLLAPKYKWVTKLLELRKAEKLLSTYVLGIQGRMRYNIIRPSFLQHGTTSGRYSSRYPNFQNLPRDDKRVKACIVSRPGKVFVGADYSQLEPRVFASVSQDETLMGCFARGEDFYSVVGAPIFEKGSLSLFKNEENSFAKKYPDLRDKSKVIALATPYGRTAMQQAAAMGIPVDHSRELIERYFSAYPKVELMMLESHEQAKANGVVYNLYGRPRRIPEAKKIKKVFGNTPHAELPYQIRSLLNLAMNHRVQSTGASVMNRAAIAFWRKCRENEKQDPRWSEVRIVLQVHDELIAEGPEALAELIVDALKDAMENTVTLPGVSLQAEPKIANNLADLK